MNGVGRKAADMQAGVVRSGNLFLYLRLRSPRNAEQNSTANALNSNNDDGDGVAETQRKSTKKRTKKRKGRKHSGDVRVKSSKDFTQRGRRKRRKQINSCSRRR